MKIKLQRTNTTMQRRFRGTLVSLLRNLRRFAAIALPATWLLMAAGVAVHADLYTGPVASLEWKVHSSDAIYLVFVGEGKKISNRYDVQFRKTIKPAKEASWNPQELAKSWRPFDESAIGEEWLLFVRMTAGRPRVMHLVNLSFPLKQSRTSAVTANGTPLRNRSEVLQAVQKRLALKREMTEFERKFRDEVDRGTAIRSVSSSYPREHASYRKLIGGFRKPIDCDFWDNPQLEDEDEFPSAPADEDMILTHAVVPADPEYRQPLLDFIEWSCRPVAERKVKNRAVWPVGALFNYPGDDVKPLLRKYLEHVSYSQEVTDILRYFKFQADRTDPLNRQLVGRWQIRGQSETINIELLEDGQFRAYGRPKPFPNPNRNRREWWGIGRWIVSDGELTLQRTQVQLTERGRSRHSLRTIFEDRQILGLVGRELKLAGGPLVVKRTDPKPQTKKTVPPRLAPRKADEAARDHHDHEHHE